MFSKADGFVSRNERRCRNSEVTAALKGIAGIVIESVLLMALEEAASGFECKSKVVPRTDCKNKGNNSNFAGFRKL